MKISLKWLNEFVSIQDYMNKPEALADVLTKAGLEVEEIKNLSKDFENVVVGLILEKDKHPQADKLSLCRVTTGEGVVHQIVCGAQNHKTNDKVVVALPGAILPGNFAIKKAVVRGIESGGMLCSLKELGLAGESEGIYILPETAPIGASFAVYQGLDDVSFELKVTANRADCLSHFGLAREVACLLGRELKSPQINLSSQVGKTSEIFSLDVKAADLCPRYTGRFIRNVKVGSSPEWLKKRLELIGMNSINNIVDATNYVMMELGQPLHAFDAAQIQGKKVIVDRSNRGEKFITLAETELLLTGEELMIKDTQHNLCVAGVIGGKNSGVSDKTTEVFLESAYFLPLSARRSMRGHGINTDSGYRFARGVDPENALVALNRATEIILKIAGGECLLEPLDFYPVPHKKAGLDISTAMISERLGYKADAKKFENFMNRLGCQVENKGDGQFKILPPSFRFDLEQEMDLVEEYARLDGYENIPEALPALNMIPSSHDANYVLQKITADSLRAQGFSEAQHLIFVGSKTQAQFLQNIKILTDLGLSMSEMPVKVLNPLNEEQDCLRQTLSYGLFKNILNNFHQGNEYGRLFEIGKSFLFEGPEKYKENWRLGLSAWGQIQGIWQKQSSHAVVFELKAAVENWLKSQNVNSFKWLTISNKGEVPAFIHRGQVAILQVEGKKCGFIGTLHPTLLDEQKIRVDCALGEIDLEIIFKNLPRIKKAETPNRFPVMQRDLALIMPKVLKVSAVMEVIEKSAGPFFSGAEAFDIYEGENLDAGYKSVAFHLSFQDRKETLKEQVVNEAIDAILKNLKEKLQVGVR